MKIPKSVNVLGEKYKVKILDEIPDHPYAVGLCDYNAREITLLKSLKGKDKLATFLHEVNHATLWESGAGQTLSRDLTEVIVDTLAKVYVKNFMK